MSGLILFGSYAGLAAGALLTFVAHIAPKFGAGNFIRDLDRPTAFGRELSHREAHMVGVFVHLLLALFFGAAYAAGVSAGWIPGFHVLPLLGYAALLWILTGLVIMPLEGHGIFGVKHDAWFPVDALLTNVFWSLLYLGLIRLWLPA